MKKKIIINGKKIVIEHDKDIYLFDILIEHVKSPTTKGIAVAVNFDLIIKKNWNSTIINDNDIIEVVAPFPGG